MISNLWNTSLLNLTKRRGASPFRAPDDPLAYEEEGAPPARSPQLDEWIRSYLAADRDDNAGERGRALRGVIDANRASYASAGIPLYAHQPLPEDLVDELVAPISRLEHALRPMAIARLVDEVDPPAREIVKQQVLASLMATERQEQVLDRRRGTQSLADVENADDAFTDRPLEVDTERRQIVGELQTSYGQPQTKRPKRIVTPYRRYAPVGGFTGPDAELQEAEAIAADADATIRLVTAKVFGNPLIEGSGHPFLKEFGRAVRRYYSEGADRAVAAVATRLKELSIDGEQYAAYSGRDDRIYFTRLNRHVSSEEKIITVIHEVLHATLTMRNEAARVGYANAPKGSMIRAKHEAHVDNVAKTLAKMLGLIPKNYPPTKWTDYYRP